MQKIFFSDIDGTFINDEYSAGRNFIYARQLIKQNIIPVFISSRTFAELKYFLRSGNINACLIGENGAFIFIPGQLKKKYSLCNDSAYINLGLNRNTFENVYIEMKNKFRGLLISIDELKLNEYAQLAGYDVSAARRSRKREYSYLFKFDGAPQELKKITGYAEQKKLSLQFGGKWLSLTAGINKGSAIIQFKKIVGHNISFGIGNSANDYELLKNMDFPFAVINENGKFHKDLLKIKNIRLIHTPAPAGWRFFKDFITSA